MDSNTQYNSPQPANAVVASAAKNNKRTRNRKSNNLQQAAGQLDNGNVSDSPNLSASPATAAQQTPKAKTRHNSTTVKHTNSPRGKPHNAQPATPLKREEYAGAQFFASSPAPGSLPLPKFFRSNIPPTATPDRAVQDEVELPAADSPSKAPTKTQPTFLEQVFEAHRQEKANWDSQARQDEQARRSQVQPTFPRDFSSAETQTPPRQPSGSPFGNSLPQQQIQSPYGVRAEDRTFNGQNANSEPTNKDTKAMADDLKRILKIGNFS